MTINKNETKRNKLLYWKKEMHSESGEDVLEDRSETPMIVETTEPSVQVWRFAFAEEQSSRPGDSVSSVTDSIPYLADLNISNRTHQMKNRIHIENLLYYLMKKIAPCN